MQVYGRKSVATAVTVAMHSLIFLGAFSFVPTPLDIELDLEFDMVEVELIDPDMIQGEDPNAEVPVVEPEPEPEQPETPPEPEPPKPAEPEPEPEPETPEDEGPVRDLGKRRSKVNKLGPASSNYHVLLSTRNIRKLPFADEAMSTIAPLPDFVYLVEKGGFDPLKDFDHILIASSNLRSATQTFLAVDYRLSREAVKAKIETAVAASNETIEWKDTDGNLSGNPVPADGTTDYDPRHFVLLKKSKIAVLVRPEFLPAVLGEEVGEEKTQANLVSELTKLRRYSRRIPTAGLQFVAHDLHAALKRVDVGAFELPDHIELTVEARKEPEFHTRFQFASVVASKRFIKFWNEKVGDLVENNLTAKIMVGGLINDIEVERSGKTVTMWGELEQEQIKLILVTSASLAEKHQARLEARAIKRRRRKAKKEAAANEQKPTKP